MERIEDKIISICLREFKHDCGEPEQAGARRQIRSVLRRWFTDRVRTTARALSQADNLRKGSS